MKKLLLVFIFLFLPLSIWFALPANVKAATTAEIQAQIQALMAQIAQLQAQLAELQGNNGVAWCHDFNRNISRGETTYAGNSDIEVASLETALVKEGLTTQHFGDSVSYDNRIASAVSAFQEKYASEILTPSGLKKGTGYAGPATRRKLNALYGCTTACSNLWWLDSSNTTCQSQKLFCGTYMYYGLQTFNTQQACLNARTPQCSTDNDCPTLCPSCAVNVPQCSGQCITYKCVSGKCTPSSSNLPPVISGVSGSIVLNINQTGTWTVSASDPENGALSYSVVWGDEAGYAAQGQTATPNTGSFIQTATFTHSYSTSGAYSPRFYVKDNVGNIVQSSISVNVGSSVSSCTDSDGGKNYSVRGSLAGICLNNTPCGMWVDSCVDLNNLVEYFCDAVNYNSNFEIYRCPNGCINGACK